MVLMMILSPAKSLDLEAREDILPTTQPNCSETKTKLVAQIMKKQTKSNLASLLNLSPTLAATAHQYWKNFVTDPGTSSKTNRKAALFLFTGAAYQGLDAKTITKQNHLQYLQDSLRIIDPLYGSLKPMDLIQPYRLEMATKGIVPSLLDNDNDSEEDEDVETTNIDNSGTSNTVKEARKSKGKSKPQKQKKKQQKVQNLAEWWKTAVTRSIRDELLFSRKANDDELILVNLASEEYSAAVDPALLPANTRYIKIIFHQEGRVISIHAKRARGLMVRFLAQHGVETADEIKNFDLEGYKFQKQQKDGDNNDTFVFNRPKPTTNITSNKSSSSSGAATKKKNKTTTKTAGSKRAAVDGTAAKTASKDKAQRKSRRTK